MRKDGLDIIMVRFFLMSTSQKQEKQRPILKTVSGRLRAVMAVITVWKVLREVVGDITLYLL